MSEIDEDMKRQIAEEKRRRDNETKLTVSIDVEQVKQVMKQNEFLQSELENAKSEAEDYKSKLELIAQKHFDKRKAEAGCTDPNITDPDELKEWERKNKAPSGNIPLSQAQISSTENSEGFDSYEELVDSLRDMEASGNAQEKEYAKGVLNKLFENWTRNVRKNPEEARMGTKELLEPYKDVSLQSWLKRKHLEPKDEEST